MGVEYGLALLSSWMYNFALNMKSQGCFGWVLGLTLLFALLTLRGYAVMFKSTADPSYNASAPTPPSLTNSGWQYEGEWVGVLATPIAPRFFLAAKHVNGAPGQVFVLDGFTNHTVAYFDCVSCDLRVWEVAETLPRYAPLYTATNEVGKHCVVFGRGTDRGPAVLVNSSTRGWEWGNTNNIERWGENDVASIVTDPTFGDFLHCTFDQGGNSNECALSYNDSGGGIFIQDGTTWKLAGVHSSVDGPFSHDGTANTKFNGALTDLRGLYYQNSTNGWTLIPTNNMNVVVPTGFYSTRVSAHVDWINSVIDFQTGPDLQIVDSEIVGADAQISLTTDSNHLYRVDRTTNLVSGVWATVTNNLPGTGGIVTVIDPGAASKTNQFYRAAIVQ